MYLKAVHPLFVWAARSRQPKPENKTRVKGFLGGMQSKKGNLQKKQWLSSSNSLPCSFTYFAWWQMKGLCASLALFWFLCHSNGKEGESAESPVCLHTLNTNITSLFIKHVGPQSCPALVRLVLLNSQGRGVQEGRCHCVNYHITGNTAHWFQSIPPQKCAACHYTSELIIEPDLTQWSSVMFEHDRQSMNSSW